VYVYIPLQAPLKDDDAVVVARKWLIEGGLKGIKITMDDVEDEIASLASVPKGTNKIRQAIIHLGNELVAENYVQLSKEGGLHPSDVKVNV